MKKSKSSEVNIKFESYYVPYRPPVKMEEMKLVNDLKEKLDIINEILKERQRQDDKWGREEHPLVYKFNGKEATGEDLCRYYDIPSEQKAKNRCDNVAKNGTITWTDIIIEEVSEVVSASNDKDRRTELVQLGAVIVAAIECLDRKSE